MNGVGPIHQHGADPNHVRIDLEQKGLSNQIFHFERALRCGFDSDEEMLEALGALTERAELLLSLRLARRRLATELRGRMHELAERYRADPEAASTALAALLASAEEVAVYPGLDPLPVEELESWASLAWDERRFEFVSADSLPASATHTPES